MEKILVSGCLLGLACRYDQKEKSNERVLVLLDDYQLIPFCPEILGGLPTPRVPAEIKDNKVINKEGLDVTANYTKGAEEALKLAKLYNIKKAILKAKSPSCGVKKIYDGTFSGRLVEGDGITTRLFKENNIEVITEEDL